MHECYLQEASSLMQKIKETVAVLRLMASPQVIAEIESYLGHADRQMDQIRRRVIFGEVIPHGEKVFSVFELGRPNWPKELAYFLGLHIGAQNPSRMGIIGQ
jgi:hypothetical protein